MAASLEVNKMLAALLTAGIIASGTGVISRIIYHPHMPEENAYPIEVTETTGGAKEAEPEAPPLPVLLADGSAEHGQAVAKACAACHNLGEGEPNKIGPHLYGVLGRDIASVSDFSYSSALSEKEGAWDYDQLNQFLTSPKAFAPGTKMTFAGLKKPQDRADVILYLRSLAANPEPLPEASAAAQPAAPKAEGEQPAAEQPPPAASAGQEQAPPKAGEDQQQAAATEGAAKAPAAGADGEGDFAQLLAAADPAEGERSAKICKACHTFEAGEPGKIGPNLHGVVGRDIASAEGFSYSSALQGKDGDWDYDKLNQFLTSPKAFAPGTKMAFVGLKKPEQRAAVIAYLRSITDNPPPLPGSG